jgi:hypothetical protein
MENRYPLLRCRPLRARREWPRHRCSAEQRDELAPRARVDGIGTAHGAVVELAHELVAGAAGECLDRFTLSAVAVLIRPDISR